MKEILLHYTIYEVRIFKNETKSNVNENILRLSNYKEKPLFNVKIFVMYCQNSNLDMLWTGWLLALEIQSVDKFDKNRVLS